MDLGEAQGVPSAIEMEADAAPAIPIQSGSTMLVMSPNFPKQKQQHNSGATKKSSFVENEPIDDLDSSNDNVDQSHHHQNPNLLVMSNDDDDDDHHNILPEIIRGTDQDVWDPGVPYCTIVFSILFACAAIALVTSASVLHAQDKKKNARFREVGMTLGFCCFIFAFFLSLFCQRRVITFDKRNRRIIDQRQLHSLCWGCCLNETVTTEFSTFTELYVGTARVAMGNGGLVDVEVIRLQPVLGKVPYLELYQKPCHCCEPPPRPLSLEEVGASWRRYLVSIGLNQLQQ